MNAAVPLLLTVALSVGGAADEHLLAGARHFTEAHYENALVEFDAYCREAAALRDVRARSARVSEAAAKAAGPATAAPGVAR